MTVSVQGSSTSSVATLTYAQLLWGVYLQNELVVENYVSEADMDNQTVVRRLNFEERNFVSIIGVDCHGCRKPIRYCDKAIKKTC